MTMETCNNSLTISVSTRNKYILLFIPLNSSEMMNSMCGIEIGLFEFMKRSLWSMFSTSLNLWSSNSIFIESAPSNVLLSWIVGDAWSTSLDSPKFHGILDLLIVLWVPKVYWIVYWRPLSFDSTNLASLLCFWTCPWQSMTYS